MAKSNRRRKLDRAKRQVRDVQRQAAAGRRLAEEEAIHDSIARYQRLLKPGGSVAELVAWLDELCDGDPVSIFVVNRMRSQGSSLERLAEVANAMLAPSDMEGRVLSLTALTFAAEVARAQGQAVRANELLDQAVAVAGDQPERRMALVEYLRGSGRLADCIWLLEAILSDTPDDDRAAEFHGMAIHEAYIRANHPSEPCSCGRGASWQQCCGPQERAALGRFTDRSGLTAISDAVAAFLARSAYGRAVDDHVADFVVALDDLDWRPDDLASLRALLTEHALLAAKLPVGGPGNEGDHQEREAVGSLAAFAADPSVPRELAAKADTWRTHIHYGLWRIDGQSAAPGLWCTDLCSGLVRYAEFPAQLMDGWLRWSVWLGGLVPVDGVWRATGTGYRLSPAEGDAAAELVLAQAASALEVLAGKKTRSSRSAETMRFGYAEPIGVLVDGRDTASSDMASVMGMVVGHRLLRIVCEVYLHRWTPPALGDTDGDEMCCITAEIAVNDSDQVSDRLASRPGFERDPDDPTHIVWYGLRIPEPQRKGTLAEAGAQPGTFGLADADLEDPAEPERWVRAKLSVGTGQIVAQVNSDKLLARLLDMLSKIGASPTVTDEKRIDPAQDSAWFGGASAHPSGTAPPGEGWEKYWLDEELPALGGLTPREAAEGKEGPMLEAILRQFEYEADLLAAQGQHGIDTDWLRQELDMADDAVEGFPEKREQAQSLPD